RTTSDRGDRRAERTRNVVCVGQVSRERRNGPAMVSGPELGAGVKKPIRGLPLDRVVERGEENRALPRCISANRQLGGLSDSSPPLKPCTSRPFWCIDQPVAGDVGRDAACAGGGVSVVPGVQPGDMPASANRSQKASLGFHFESADRGFRSVR